MTPLEQIDWRQARIRDVGIVRYCFELHYGVRGEMYHGAEYDRMFNCFHTAFFEALRIEREAKKDAEMNAELDAALAAIEKGKTK